MSLLRSLVLLLFFQTVGGQEVQPDRAVPFKKIGDDELILHIFEPEGHKKTDRRPAIVFFFGGGWVGGSPNQFFPQCDYLAKRGMVAISAQYRTKKSHDTSPRECVADGKSALRWVRSRADKLGIDPDRIAAGGGSAGGHVAAAVATTKGFDGKDDDLAISCRPNALVLFNPVFDNGPDGWGHGKVKEYWEEISPMHNISKSIPPTTVFLGTKDKLIPVETAEKFQQRVRDAGGRCDLHLYEGQPHGFFNQARFDETVAEMDRFLTSLGYLKDLKK